MALTYHQEVAVCDGEIDSREEEVLVQLGDHLDLVNYDIKLLLAKRKAQRHRSTQQQP